MLRDNLQPPRTPATQTRPPTAPRTRPPRPTRDHRPQLHGDPTSAGPSRCPLQAQSVRFKPDRPRQPELFRKLEERNPQPPLIVGRLARRAYVPILKLYELKPKRGKETFMERKESPLRLAGHFAPLDPKKLKRMKKKLDELNRKISHSRKKHDGMIHKRNALRKAIEVLKCDTKPEPVPEPEWNFKEREQAFGRAYRS